MNRISLPAAISLTGWSERTFFRKFADGSLLREMVNGKLVIPFTLIRPYLCIPLELEQLQVLEKADDGDVQAQNDLALIFLANAKPKSAIYWLELAARQSNADAMNLLAHCYAVGSGVAQDDNMSMMWLAKAAAQGHVISQGQMQGMRDMIYRKSVKAT